MTLSLTKLDNMLCCRTHPQR